MRSPYRTLLVVGIVLVALSCRTTKPQEAATTAESKESDAGDAKDASGPEGKAAATSSGAAAGVQFSSDDEQALYLKMLTVETNAGVKVPKDQLHTSRGLVECRRTGGQAPCTFRVRLEGLELSATQPVASRLAPSLWTFAQTNRPELKGEAVVLMNLLCDYIVTKSPPYKVTSVHCEVNTPRSEDEAVFFAKAAEELSEGIRSGKPYGPKMVTLTGLVSCQWLKASPRTPCIVRAQVGGVLDEKITEMSAGVAAEVARGLKQAVSDHAKVTSPSGPNAKGSLEESQNIVGVLTCLVDNTSSEVDGKRSYACRAKI